MKECFICFENILHGIQFGCKHEMCLYCFMKLEQNLCPYCRFPMHEIQLTHYSKHIPPFLTKICNSKDLFTFILLQMYHTQSQLFRFPLLIQDIRTWSISPRIKQLYIHEIQVLYKYMHPERKQLLILLFNMLLLSFLTRNDIYLVRVHPHFHTETFIILYPIFVIVLSIFIGYSLFYLWEKRNLQQYNYRQRLEIKIENILA